MWEKGASPIFKEKQPSLLASAVIHAARSEEIHPIENRNQEKASEETGENLSIKTSLWPSELQTLTGWELKDIDEIAKYLIKLNL